MDRYVGLDAHPTSCTFGVMGSSGKRLKSMVITQLPEHPLHKDYERMLAAGIKPNLAKLTVARKIAATVLSMWKHREVYDPQRHRAASDKT